MKFLFTALLLWSSCLFAHDPLSLSSNYIAFRQLNSVQIIDGRSIIIVGGSEQNDSIMYYALSTDSGRTFTMLADSVDIPWLKSVCFTNSLKGYAVGYG